MFLGIPGKPFLETPKTVSKNFQKRMHRMKVKIDRLNVKINRSNLKTKGWIFQINQFIWRIFTVKLHHLCDKIDILSVREHFWSSHKRRKHLAFVASSPNHIHVSVSRNSSSPCTFEMNLTISRNLK